MADCVKFLDIIYYSKSSLYFELQALKAIVYNLEIGSKSQGGSVFLATLFL